jgi:repressor LexA
VNNKDVFAKNLKYQMEVNRKSRRDVCAALGFSYYTFSDWVNGKKYPRMDKVEMLADYFGILKSDLIEERTEEHREMQKKNNIQADIVLRMQSDNDFFTAVKALHEMDPSKLSGLLAFLK